jgi:DNA-binding MarR family transcriptional regulator
VAADQHDDEGESLPELFWGVAHQLRHLSRETLEPWGVAPGHSRALNVLRHHGAVRLSELSDRLHIAPRSATEVVDALEKRGLAERRPDPDDRRATLVTLTEHGRSVAEAIVAARSAEAERFFGELSESDRTHLGRILGKLRR